MFGFVPCSNYIGSCGYKSSSRKEKSAVKRAREMKTQEMCKGISKCTVLSLFVLHCPSVSSLDVSDISLDRAVVLASRPFSNKICSSTALSFPKYSCYATKSAKTSSRVPKNVQRPVILPHRGGQAFLFH